MASESKASPDPKQEEKQYNFVDLIGSQPYGFLTADRGLPQTIDDAEQMFGMGIYDQMLNDPDLQGLFNGLRAQILERGYLISPAVAKPLPNDPPEEVARHEQALIYGKFVEAELKLLAKHRRGFGQVLAESFRALVKGHVICEVTYRDIEQGPHKGLRGLRSIRVIPRENYALAVDPYNNFLGVTARQPGRQFIVRVGYIGDAREVPSFIGRDKLLLFSWDVKDDDPRGQSLLRACYRPWKKAQLLDPERVKFGVQYGGGRIVHTRGPKDLQNPGTSEMTNAEVAAALERLGTGGIAVTEPGSDTTVLMPNGDTQYFLREAEDIRRQYALALTTSIRAFLEAKHGSRADSEQGDTLLTAFISLIQEHWEPVINEMLIRPLIAHNWGDEIAGEFCPEFSFVRGDSDEFVANAGAVSTLISSGGLPEAMRPAVYRERLGIEYEGDGQEPKEAGGLEK